MSNQLGIDELAAKLGHILLERKIHCAVAESCTGGSLAAAITEIPGTSQWFDRAFVTYTNVAKEEMLAVPHEVLASQGAVSEATARAMAQGAISASDAEVSVAITGIAGPSGGTREKPVGTVWIAWAGDLQPTHSQCYLFEGDRAAIRQQAVRTALQGLIQRCDPKTHPLMQYSGSERYYFALWPNEKTAHALYKQGESVISSSQCSPVLLKNLHLTLVYLGRAHPEFVQLAMQIAGQLQVAPATLTITHADFWPHAKLCWLGLEETPPGLDKLVLSLNQGLIAAGFKPEKRLFKPHVTIARQCTEKNPQVAIAPITWVVNDFCLVKSRALPGVSHYEIIGRWPLRAPH